MLFKEANQKAIQKKLKMARNCVIKKVKKLFKRLCMKKFLIGLGLLKKSCKLFFLIPESDYFQNEIFKK